MKIDQKKIAVFCDVIRALVPECRLKISPDGFRVLAVDAANVAMVSVRLPKDAFEEFAVEPGEIGMDVDKWKRGLQICQNSPTGITLKGGKVLITDGLFTYTMTPLDPSTVRKAPTSPSLTSLPGSVTVPGKDLHEVINSMGKIGDKVRLTMKGIALEISTEGDTDKLVRELQSSDGKGGSNGIATALFSIEYLADIGKVLKGADTVAVHMANDHPVRFDFEIEGMECSYLVAPRIEAA
jgi:proliferating cell nuclear antigen